MNITDSSSLPSKLKYSSSLRAASKAAAVAGGGFFFAQAASGAIVAVSVNHSLPTGSDWVSFNPVGTNFELNYNNNDFPGAVRSCSLNLSSFNTSAFQWAGSGSTPTLFNPGDTVDVSTTFSGVTNYFTSLPDGEVGYFGYRFSESGEDFYGYIQITGGADISDFTFNYYSFNSSPDEGIMVVPEPSFAAAILGITVLGLVLANRKLKSFWAARRPS